MPQLKRQFIETSTGQLHLRVTGSIQQDHSQLATPIVCLHMMPKSGRGYATLMPFLAKNRLVIAPDYPGYGESDPLPPNHTPKIKDYADSIQQVIEHFEFQSVNLLGYHTGSMVAVELAHRLPKKVQSVVTISAPIFTAKELDEFRQFYSPKPLDKEGTRFKTMWERIMHFRGPGMTLEMAATSLAENLRGGERYEDGHHAAFDYAETFTQRLGEIKQPLLVMNPADDLFEFTERAKTHLNNGRIESYQDWGHGFLDLWPDKVAEILLDFYSSSG